MNTKKPLKPSQHVASRKIEDETVILDLQTSDYFLLNEVGSRIWELLQEGKDEDEIVKALEREFTVDGKKARKDVGAFMGQLKKERIATAE